MAAVGKVFSKVHKVVRKFSPERAILGDKIYDKAHFIGTSATKAADAADVAKAEAKSEKELAAEVRAQQKIQLAELDDEENRRIKKLISGARGTRSYRGGPMFRGRPSNSAGGAPRSAAGGGSASPASGALQAGGARGGLRRAGFRALIDG